MRSRFFITEAVFLLLIAVACSSNPQPVETPTPTLASGMGRVIGVLQIRSNQGAQPVKNATIYLAGTLKDSTGKETFAAFERIHSPRAVTNNEGRFQFSNVPPGNYGLVLDTIIRTYLLLRPDSAESMIIQVSAGQEVDLGTLLYDSLPLPSQPGAYPYP